MSLYRKYRPQTFADLVDQAHIVATLQKQFEMGTFGHAYLFCGPRGVGKTTTARIISKLLNCEQPKGSEPCNECTECTSLLSGRSMKLLEIDAASNRGIDDIRELRDIVRVARQSKGQFVVIIDEVHMLTAPAFNALLKTLEEPPERVVFVLATTEIQQIPATILSRCQRFDFRRISDKDMKQLLIHICGGECVSYDEDVLDRIVHHADGYGRDAIVLLEQCITLSGGERVTLDRVAPVLPHVYYDKCSAMLFFIADRNISQALNMIGEWHREGVNLRRLHTDMIEYIRLLSLYSQKVIGKEVLFDSENSSVLASRLPLVCGFFKILTILLRTSEMYAYAPLPTLPLELFVLEILEDKTDTFGGGGAGSASGVARESSNQTNQKTSQNNYSASNFVKKQNETHETGKILQEKKTNNIVNGKKPDAQKEKEPELPVIQIAEEDILLENTKPKQTENSINIDICSLVRDWVVFNNLVKEKSPALAIILLHIHPDHVEENCLVCVTKSKIHKDRASIIKAKEDIDMMLSEYVGTHIKTRIDLVGAEYDFKYMNTVEAEHADKKEKDKKYLNILNKELGLASE